jgi:predicted secreted Zn-dependent protease
VEHGEDDAMSVGGRTLKWKRSSRCESGACVEVAGSEAGRVLLRDAKVPEETPLAFEKPAWKAFIDGVKAGEFDR